ncbi:2'-5' RNA ligase family protein [Halosegnis rubeus]|uniref:2'-5' RNA ligase family protein n=1 Tax=Halosegnis rubeus TaxID=2212850 RepID=A0A5N5UMN2_9EURY|nr:2'-5' RNA ligase family protein [Halosegnis rubeus]KAB7516703.1 2'-5' RNA ligase family protein [Halosegnis rubeus]KAB7520166.1 2'-5' RNA ligase family protein [Halosegnis rubeus]
MHSVNVPVPGDIIRLARGLASECLTATPRRGHSLVVKRLPDERLRGMVRQVRSVLDGVDPFEIRIEAVDLFRQPPTGTAPVAYLAVDSAGLEQLHQKLCQVFDPVEGFEGEEYDPHVTIARGGDAASLLGREIEPREWTVDRLAVWHPGREMEVESIAL